MRAERACYACLLQQVKSLCENPQIHATRAFSKDSLLKDIGELLERFSGHLEGHSNDRAGARSALDSKHAKSPSARDISALDSNDSAHCLESRPASQSHPISQSYLISQSCPALDSKDSAPCLESQSHPTLISLESALDSKDIKDSKSAKSTPESTQPTSLNVKAQDSMALATPPPALAIEVYERVGRALGSDDPFCHIKAYSDKRAKALRDELLHTKPARDLQSALKPRQDSSNAPKPHTSQSSTSQSISSQSTALKSTTTHTTPQAPTSPHNTPTAPISTHATNAPTQANTPESSADSAPYPTRLLDWAIRLALLGNVIDYGSQSSFSFENADFSLDSLTFGEYALLPLQARLQGARTLLYLADNAGEHYFDEVLLNALKELYPALHITYGVRGRAIINDLTLKDLSPQVRQSLESHCTLLDTGVKSPGFLYEGASEQARACFDKADIILAKGMGNFECLESRADSRLFMLFKIKCDVVARFCNQPKGVMMLRHNAPTHAI